jgi:integrase
VRGSLFPDKKRKAFYFKNPKEARQFCKDVRDKGMAAVQRSTATDAQIEAHAPLIRQFLDTFGGDPVKLSEAMRHFEKTRLNVTRATVWEAYEQFRRIRKNKVGQRTWKDDNRLLKFVRPFQNYQMSEITETDLHKFFDGLKGHTRSLHKTMKVFFAWAKRYNLVGIDPMAGIKPTQAWNARLDIWPVATFERILRIAAGLEGVRPTEEPTRDFINLLPWFALSGFCGLRSCEAFRATNGVDAVKWTDLHFDRGFIEIRPEITKKTRKGARRRYIKTQHYLEALKAWLALVPRESETIVQWSEGKIGRLKREFSKRTGIKFLENGFRNSFASYALTYNGELGIGALAIEMGNSEAICKQFYIETLEPQTGAAWFNLRPDRPANIVSIQSAAA